MGRLTRRAPPVALALCAAAAWAGHDGDHERARLLVQQGRILPLEQVVGAVLREHGARVLELELEQHHGRYVYEVELLERDGAVRELVFDAASGEYLGEEREGLGDKGDAPAAD